MIADRRRRVTFFCYPACLQDSSPLCTPPLHTLRDTVRLESYCLKPYIASHNLMQF